MTDAAPSPGAPRQRRDCAGAPAVKHWPRAGPRTASLHSARGEQVHADEHWLVRDLTLQPAGPRVAADGTRCLKRMGKRRAGDGS